MYGVSELIVMSMQALLNNGDEVLVPAPDYPLWRATSPTVSIEGMPAGPGSLSTEHLLTSS